MFADDQHRLADSMASKQATRKQESYDRSVAQNGFSEANATWHIASTALVYGERPKREM